MSLLSYLLPQTVLITSSRYNKFIRINREMGKLKLLVNGSRQSGAYIKKLWKKAFQKFGITKKRQVKKILIFGVGGGTVFQLLFELFPKTHITGVDIDKTMIDIAQKYFGINTLPGVKLVCQDAKDYVKQKNNEKCYDFVVVDIFNGIDIPEFVTEIGFIASAKKLLKKDGCLLINYLRDKDYVPKSEKLKNLLHTLFFEVKDFSIRNNRFFYAK